MANINEILARAAALRNETALNSIDPERAGGIMYDTLIAMNELWLQQGAALVISKIYASVAAMNADTSPVSDLTGKPIRPGQIVVIASSDGDNGSVYRYNGPDSPSWSLVGKIGNLTPVDSLDSESTQLPLAARQGKVLAGKISQLAQKVDGKTTTYTIPVVSGTQLAYDIPVDIKSGTPISLKLDSTALINGTVNAYLYTGAERVLYTLTQNVTNNVLTATDIDKIRISRGDTGVVGTGDITVHIGISRTLATESELSDVRKKTIGTDLNIMPLTYVIFIVRNGETLIVKNKTNLALDLYFRQTQSSTGQKQCSVPALSSANFTADADYYYLYVNASGDAATVQRSVTIVPTDSLMERIEENETAISVEVSARSSADMLLEGKIDGIAKTIESKPIYLKGVSGSNIQLNTPIVLSQDGDSIEISVVNDYTNNAAAYGFANSGESGNGNYAIQFGYSILGVRSMAGAWLFKDIAIAGAKEHILKIDYTGGKIVTSVDGTTIDTQNSQTDVKIASFGDGGNGTYGYWKGTIHYVKLNGEDYNLMLNATLNNVDVIESGGEDVPGILTFDASGEEFEFFGKYKGDKFFSVKVAHEQDSDPTVLKDLWRVISGNACQKSGDSFITIAETIYTGENEWANSFADFQAYGGFVGGYHGGELITDSGCFVRFFADGKPITAAMMASDFSIVCKEFKYIQYAGLHKVQTRGENPSIIEGQPIFAYHLKITTISGGSITTKNIVTFTDTVTRTVYHSGLFCFSKASANNIILPNGVNAENLVGDNSYIDATYKLVGDGYVWNNTNNISAEITSKFVRGIDESEMLLETGVFNFWNRRDDTKYYRRTTKPVSIASGETIVTEDSVNFHI